MRVKHDKTLAGVLRRWQKLTGMPESEAQARYRYLREAGFLPVGHTRATDVQIAALVIGMLCGTTPMDAPDAAMAAFDALPVASNSDLILFREVCLGLGLAALIRAIRRGAAIDLTKLAIRTAGAEIGALVVANVAAGELLATYHCEAGTARAADVKPVEREQSIDGAVLMEIAAMASDHATGLRPGDRALADIFAAHNLDKKA
jgi:hypothetical protein